MQNWMSLIKRSMREGTKQVRRNAFLSLTTVALGVLIIFLLNTVFGVQRFTEQQLSDLEQRADYSVVLRENYDTFQLEGLITALENESATARVAPAEAWNGFEIPPRLRVQFGDLRSVEAIFAALKNPRYDGVIGDWDGEEERTFTGIITRLLTIRDGVEKLSFALIILFIIGGVLLVANTLQMVIFSRKDEIQIAQTVGAERRFIVGPFVWEGMLLGLIAAVLGIVVYTFVLTRVSLPGAGEIFAYLVDYIYGLEVLIAALTGAFGAWLAARRYIK